MQQYAAAAAVVVVFVIVVVVVVVVGAAAAAVIVVMVSGVGARVPKPLPCTTSRYAVSVRLANTSFYKHSLTHIISLR